MSPRFAVRAALDVIFGLAGTGGLILASHYESTAPLVIDAIFLALAALCAGYSEPSVKLIWLHPLFMMAPELVAAPVAYATCQGFECGAFMGIFMLGVGLTLVLLVFAFVGFLLRRLFTAKSPAHS